MSETILLTQIGAKIKELRTTKNMTQNELALRCNFEKASMSRIETGQTNPTIRTLFKISNALEVQISDLFAISPMSVSA